MFCKWIYEVDLKKKDLVNKGDVVYIEMFVF